MNALNDVLLFPFGRIFYAENAIIGKLAFALAAYLKFILLLYFCKPILDWRKLLAEATYLIADLCNQFASLL